MALQYVVTPNPIFSLSPTHHLTEHIHAVHHEIHVNYAFGGFYNHPAETIIIDAIGFPLCLSAAGLSTRQSIIATVSWTVKNVVDHCGYAFPYDPCNLLCPKSQWYHDLHHQSWGMKYNFSNYTRKSPDRLHFINPG